MKHKKVLALFLAAAMTASLTACSGGETQEALPRRAASPKKRMRRAAVRKEKT